jgi:hypothetical protein
MWNWVSHPKGRIDIDSIWEQKREQVTEEGKNYTRLATYYPTGTLFGLPDHEVGRDIFLRNVGWLWNDYTRRYIPEDSTLNNYRCESLKNYTLSWFRMSCVSTGLATGWFPIQRVLPTVCKIHSFTLILKLKRPQGLIRPKEEIKLSEIKLAGHVARIGEICIKF